MEISLTRSQLVIPAGGWLSASAIPQPQYLPDGVAVETQELADIYERNERRLYDPSDFPWDALRPEDFTPEERVGITYWYAVRADFEARDPRFREGDDPRVRDALRGPAAQVLFSITRDE